MSRISALILAALLMNLPGCVSHVSDVKPGYKPERSDEDEAGLWLQMDKAEAQLANAPERVRDPALQKYLDTLTCKLADDLCKDIRVYVVRQPYLNAFMAPNGMMVVFTGTLLRAQNEAQLAFVLGHEIGHYRSRHSLENWRHQKNVMTGLSLIGNVNAVTAVVTLGAFAELASFSRAQETQADTLGLNALKRLGLDTQAPGQMWAAAYEEERVNPKGFLSGIFASHPATLERRDRLQKLGSLGGETGAERYSMVTFSSRKAWLADEISRRNYAQSEVMLARLAELDHSGLLDYARGELFRKRAAPGDLEKSVQAYQRAAKATDAPPECFRELGTVLKRMGKVVQSKAAFAQYLKRNPDAADAAIVRSYL
jgi:beta-barrel assembly-enhancing protease